MAAVRFGGFTLDLEQGTLRHGDREVVLRAQCWQLLAQLASRGGAPISREELTRLLWRDTFVAPNTLHYLLWDLRRTLAQIDSGNYIVKVPRRGYRLAIEGELAQPSPAPQLPSAVATPEPDESAPAPPPPPATLLLDRDAQLAELHELYRRACGGQRQIVFVTGEAGIGKTTLIDAWVDQIDTGASARAACLPGLGIDEPYAPLLEIVERLAAGRDLTELLRRQAPTWLVQLPGLLPADEMQTLRQSLAGVGAARMVREGVRLLEALASERPLLLVIEDLTWADNGTLATIEALASRSERASLMLIASLRSVDLAPEHGTARALVNRLSRRAKSVTRLNLQPLTRAAVDKYVGQKFESCEQGSEIAAVLEHVSGGNPLFLMALADYLVRSGLVDHDGGGWQIRDDIRRIEPELPESLRGMIGDQLDLLPGSAIATLEAASVAGVEFTSTELAAGLEGSLHEVDANCAQMAREGQFIISAPSQTWPDGTTSSTYRFRHILYQRAVYDRVAPETRRSLHHRIGKRLAAAYRDHIFDVTTRLAQHFEAADDLVELGRYQEMAAMLAQVRFSPPVAQLHVERAIATIKRLPPSLQRDQREAERQIDYVNLAILTEGFSSEKTWLGYDRAYELAFRHELPLLQFRVELGRCFQRLMNGETDEARQLAARLIAMAEDGQPHLTSAAYFYSSMANTVEVPMALKHCDIALEALETWTQWTPRYDLRSSIGSHQTVLLSIANRPEEAKAVADTTIEIATALRSPVEITGVATFCAVAAIFRGDPVEAQRLGEYAVRCGEENDIPTYAEVASMARDWGIQAQSGRGLTRLERAVTRRARSKEMWYQGVFEVYLAEALCQRGELEKAQHWLDAAAEIGELLSVAERWRVQGEVYRRGGQVGKAATEECFRKARRIARRQGTATFEQRAAQALAADG